jgi:hypothetical protein
MCARPSAALAVLFVVIGATAVAAQEAGVAQSFEQLQRLVEPNDALTVTDRDGVETRGRLIAISASALQLQVEGRRVELAQDRIRTVAARRGDGLANGALWGLVIGAAFGAAVEAIYDDDDDPVEADAVLLSTGVYAGVGLGIGLALDAAIQRQYVIYERPGASGTSLLISPLVGPGRRGVRVAWSF